MKEYQLHQHIRKLVGDALYTFEWYEHDGIVRTGPQIGHQPGYKSCRMDFEVTDEELETWADPVQRAKAEMMTVLVMDLCDLYWNGDVNSTDPLLKSVDGFVKNPARPEPVFANVQIIEEYKAKKNSTEFTLYFHVN